MLLSPHIAGSTDEAQEAIGIQLAKQVRDYLKLGVVQNAVNVPSLSHEEYAEVAPYIEMAERLGDFLSHAIPGTSRDPDHLCRPAGAGQDGPDPQCGDCGLLAESEGSSEVTQPNRINAAAIAQERGIRMQEDKKEFTTGGTGRR